MQTILGSGGSISKVLVPELAKYTDHIRLAGRDPKPYTGRDELFRVDLLDTEGTSRAVEGSDIVYLLAGLQYDIRVWKASWPRIMANVIEACSKHKAKLVFLDNVYMYGLVKGWMNEETPYNPYSRKGEVRAGIANLLMDKVKQGDLQALIARSADFLGPGATNTFMHPMIFMKFKDKKSGQWIANDNVRHSFSYTPDLGKAVALLGNAPDAFNQVWHLPAAKDAVCGKEFISIAARAMGVDPKYSVLKTWMMRLVSPFSRMALESIEMAYQYEYEYLFDSSKFESRFFKATPSAEAVKLTADSYKVVG
ncbi:MAG: NAD-dependent dehydratase [Bacteroidetes bacterium]|nr:NAD-dependent dehydratase [Bacteroidota bacterium]